MLPRLLPAVVAVLVLAGCTVGAPVVEEAADADPCAALGEPLTLLFNTRVSFQQGRMSEGEFNEASRLVTRLLGRVEAQQGTEVGDLILEAQEFAPSMELIDASAPPDFLSDEWALISEALGQACYEAGTPIELAGWTGG